MSEGSKKVADPICAFDCPCGHHWSELASKLVVSEPQPITCPSCGRPWHPFDGTYPAVKDVFMPPPPKNPDSPRLKDSAP